MKRIDIADIGYLIVAIMCGGLIGYIFYQNLVMSVIIGLLATLTLRQFRTYRKRVYRAKIIDEFLAVNRMLISELHAGKSVSMAYRGIYERLESDTFDHNCTMKRELRQWCIKMDAGMNIMDILREFSDTYDDEYITQFYTMMEVSVENGASLLDVIEMTDRVIKDQRHMQQEIDVLVSEKKFEQRILSLAPLALLVFLQNLSYEFIAPLYVGIAGRVVMSIALFIFVLCFLWSKKITEVIQ